MKWNLFNCNKSLEASFFVLFRAIGYRNMTIKPHRSAETNSDTIH